MVYGVATYSLYIRLVVTGITYPQEVLTPRLTSLVTSTLLDRFPSGNACIIFLSYLMSSWLSMTLKHFYPNQVMGDMVWHNGFTQHWHVSVVVLVPMVKGGVYYIGVSLVYRSHNWFVGDVKKCKAFLKTFFNRCGREPTVIPSQAYFLWKRRGVGALCHPMSSWICINTIISCPGVINRGANTIGVYSSQTITFRMVTSSHFFNGIKERAHAFIPLNFRHRKDTRFFFSYLNGVWEWVQVTSDHVDNN